MSVSTGQYSENESAKAGAPAEGKGCSFCGFTGGRTKGKRRLFKQMLLAFLTCAAASGYALDRGVGLGNPDSDFKYTTCELKNWDSRKVLSNKPGPNDRLRVYYRKNLDLDADANFAYLEIMREASVSSTGRLGLRVNREISFDVGGSGDETSLKLNKCRMLAGALKFSCPSGAKELGLGTIHLDDSVLIVKGGMLSEFPTDETEGVFDNRERRGGISFDLKGKSFMRIEGDVVHDPKIKDNPDDFIYKITFTEKNGDMPTLSFLKLSNIMPADIEIVMQKAPANGVYTLVELETRIDSLKAIRSIKFNGTEASDGDSFEIGKKTVTLKIGASNRSKSRDRTTPNDLILEVK